MHTNREMGFGHKAPVSITLVQAQPGGTRLLCLHSTRGNPCLRAWCAGEGGTAATGVSGGVVCQGRRGLAAAPAACEHLGLKVWLTGFESLKHQILGYPPPSPHTSAWSLSLGVRECGDVCLLMFCWRLYCVCCVCVCVMSTLQRPSHQSPASGEVCGCQRRCCRCPC